MPRGIRTIVLRAERSRILIVVIVEVERQKWRANHKSDRERRGRLRLFYFPSLWPLLAAHTSSAKKTRDTTHGRDTHVHVKNKTTDPEQKDEVGIFVQILSESSALFDPHRQGIQVGCRKAARSHDSRCLATSLEASAVAAAGTFDWVAHHRLLVLVADPAFDEAPQGFDRS